MVLAVYAWAALALVAGQDLLTNPVFVFAYVWIWVGLVPLSLLLGPWWRVTNPLRAVHAALCRVARLDPELGLVDLPPAVGVWPAAGTLFGFAWLELVQPDRATLAVLRLWAAAWLAVVVVGAVVFGARCVAAADPFEAYATVVSQLCPLRRVARELRLVNPLAGLNAWRPPPGAPAVVSVLLGSTAYDSFANTSWWIQTVQTSPAPYPGLLAASVVPIVIGYAVAHYFTLLVIEGQRTAINYSDPLGRGWNVFGSAEMGVNSAIYNHPTAIALVQLSAIVIGHVVGIVAAHEKALALLRPDATLQGQ